MVRIDQRNKSYLVESFAGIGTTSFQVPNPGVGMISSLDSTDVELPTVGPATTSNTAS